MLDSAVSFDKFKALVSQGFNHIPVDRQIFADLDTPLSCYLKLAASPFSYLLESVQGGEKWGRYSIIGLPCRQYIQVIGNDVQVVRDEQMIESVHADDPLDWIEQFQRRYKVPEIDDLPRFVGGLVGYFGYDTISYIEEKLSRDDRPDPVGTPDIMLLQSDELVVFDNLRNTMHLVVHAEISAESDLSAVWEQAQQRLDKFALQLRSNNEIKIPQNNQQVNEDDFISAFEKDKYEASVKKIKQFIRDGDVMQVVLSQRMSVPYANEPLNLYRALRCLNPSPYMYFMDLGGFHVVGSSPEILVRLEAGEVTVRPIAGTRPRGANEAEDQRLEDELLADPKERSEHLMLIDLGRNDVGRISQTGSVKLTAQYEVERYSHVMHIISNVIGQLKPGLSCMDVLRATFPAGTLSGAPKIRAMEIIQELEPLKRGIYSGAVGYLSWTGNMDTAIAIRTAVIKDEVLYIQAGAGIVADSVPSSEWEETLNKGRAIFKAVEIAQAGLD
jgi:anthranilate synthase component I